MEMLVVCSASPVRGSHRGHVGKVTQLMLPSQRIPPWGLFRVSHSSGDGEGGIGALHEYPRTVASVDSPCTCDLSKTINDQM